MPSLEDEFRRQGLMTVQDFMPLIEPSLVCPLWRSLSILNGEVSGPVGAGVEISQQQKGCYKRGGRFSEASR